MSIRSLFIATLLSSICLAANAQATALLLFGGSDHKAFLGCLNCGNYSTDSVCNAYGRFGSPYNSNSIWNAYGTYGSQYGSHSPWNSYSTSAPAVVDKEGNFYGYLSANQYMNKRTTIKGLVELADASQKFDDLQKLSDAFCGR